MSGDDAFSMEVRDSGIGTIRTCPNCRFLLPEDTETCSVCGQDLTGPATGSPEWARDPDGGDASEHTPRRLRRRRSRARQPGTVRKGISKMAVLAVLAVAVAVVATVYRLNTGEHIFSRYVTFDDYRIEVREGDWRRYTDPEGRFSDEVPGPVDRRRVPVDLGRGVTNVDVAVTEAPARTIVATVALPAGSSPDLSSASEKIAEAAFGDVEGLVVTHAGPTGTPFGAGTKVRLRGTRDGEAFTIPATAFVADGALWVVATAGPVAETAEVLDIQDQLLGSLAIPAAPTGR